GRARRRVDPLPAPAAQQLQRVPQLAGWVAGGAADLAKQLLEIAPRRAREFRDHACASGAVGNRNGAAPRVRSADHAVVMQERSIEQYPGKIRLRMGSDAKAPAAFPIAPRGGPPSR